MDGTGDGEVTGARRVPVPAVALGAAGLLPPLLAILARITATANDDFALGQFAMVVGLQYVSLILSFLGGMWWGIAAARLPATRIAPWLLVAVSPSLVAIALHILSNWFPGPSVVALGLAVAATLPVDRRLVRAGLAPRWWMKLRAPLSLGLAGETLVLAVLL